MKQSVEFNLATEMKAKTALRYRGEASVARALNEPPASGITHRASGLPVRILTAVPICDGHDSAINTINLEFIRHGIEVIYLGYHRSAREIARAAIQEDLSDSAPRSKPASVRAGGRQRAAY